MSPRPESGYDRRRNTHGSVSTEFRRLVSLLAVGQSAAPTAEWLVWHLRELYREIPGLELTSADVRRFLRAEGDRLLIREPVAS